MKATSDLIQIVKSAIHNTEKGITNLPEEIFLIPGMSGKKGRMFLNNISYEGSNYLEIGTWKGSTLCSYLYGKNLNKSFSIDNYSQFGNPKQDLLNNISKFYNLEKHVHLEFDSFDINLKNYAIENIDVYFYDGAHKLEDHENSLTYYIDCLSDKFIFIVDDWNGKDVRLGTLKAIEKLNLINHFYVSLPEESILFTSAHGDSHGYWNGLGVFVLEKSKL